MRLIATLRSTETWTAELEAESAAEAEAGVKVRVAALVPPEYELAQVTAAQTKPLLRLTATARSRKTQVLRVEASSYASAREQLVVPEGFQLLYVLTED